MWDRVLPLSEVVLRTFYLTHIISLGSGCSREEGVR